MRFGQGLLDEILRRTDLVQLVGRRVKLVRKGKVMWGCCPFHQEKSPSFKVENERRTYKCFGCGAGGDAFKWLMETEGLSFPDAVSQLAEAAGVDLPAWSPEDEAREQKKKSLYDVIEAACVFYQAQLAAPVGHEGRAYFAHRGLDAATIARFRLGYAPEGRAGLIDHLRGLNIALDDIIAAGLARPAEDGRPARDFFFHRVMFPISDARGRIIAFGARALSPEAKPKYINTGETVLFSKGHNLYNFASARPQALKAGTIILAEGYMDVIALARAGFGHAVAPLGTALTEDQLGLLWKVAPEPVLAFDGDEAGRRAGMRAAHLALPHLKPGHSLRFAFLPPGEDPDTLIAQGGAAAMSALLERAEPLFAVLWGGETADKDFSTPERRAGLELALSELVSRIGDSSVAAHYRQAFRDKVNESFRRPTSAKVTPTPGRAAQGRGYRRGPPLPPWRLESVSSAVKNSPIAQSSEGAARRIKEEELLALTLAQPELVARHAEALAALVFSEPTLDSLRQELLNLAASGFRLEKQRLEDHLVRSGHSGLVDRLKGRLGRASLADAAPGENSGEGGAVDGEEIEARWLAATARIRDLADLASERAGAIKRFERGGDEESWREFLRFRAAQTRQGEG